MGYTRDVIKGLSWLGGLRIVTRGLVLVKTLIVARALTPLQFGIFGIVTLLLTFIEILTETGINIFLIQQKDAIDRYVNTAWIVSIIRGFIIGGIIFILALFIANFFHVSQAYGVITLSSIIPMIRGFINPSIIKLQKELRFNQQFYYQASLLFVESLVSITLVIITHSVYSLIYGMIAGVACEMVLSHIIVKPTPRIIFQKDLFTTIVNHGKWITASTIFDYFYQHGDDIAIGRLLNAVSLGFYDMAYKISLAPLTDFADVIGKVAFPVYVKISHDKKRLQRAFLKTLFVVIVVVVPIGLVLSLFAKEIILVVLGQKWLPAVPALQILGIFGIVRAISVFTNSVFLSIKKQNIVSLISLVGLSGLGLTIIPFVYWWGIVGAGLSALLGTSLTLPVIFYYLRKHILIQQ